MNIVDITKDLPNATLVVSSVFSASPERVWRLWADPRQLERWWGPDPYPATVVDHDLRPGGHVAYYMTGPDGDQHKGYWHVLEVEPPRRLVFEDGFADDSGAPNDELPVSRAEVTIEAVDETRTRMTLTSVYDTTAELELVLGMGMEEGIRTAFEQVLELLAEG
jgi:uncharacterized protein YndB with AHSA1/START domain